MGDHLISILCAGLVGSPKQTGSRRTLGQAQGLVGGDYSFRASPTWREPSWRNMAADHAGYYFQRAGGTHYSGSAAGAPPAIGGAADSCFGSADP